jgi:hypothetical protein
MLAAAVGVDGEVEVDVGRVVADFTSSKITCVGTAERRHSVGVGRRPAVVEGLTHVPGKSVRQPRGRAAAFDGVERELELGHGAA